MRGKWATLTGVITSLALVGCAGAPAPEGSTQQAVRESQLAGRTYYDVARASEELQLRGDNTYHYSHSGDLERGRWSVGGWLDFPHWSTVTLTPLDDTYGGPRDVEAIGDHCPDGSVIDMLLDGRNLLKPRCGPDTD
jgi:hypothetical protein